MLGCQDFCGYYDWTFHYTRRRFGQEGVRKLWSDAIGGESQKHYTDAGSKEGLLGLYKVWTKTGEDEKCDWTFTLDESKNVLRWDMRQCPSKGLLINNDLNADEDYCDHCMGWMGPLLARVGVEVAVHEHNHAGQCWGEMRMKDKPYTPLDLPIDIRKDARWNRGFIERWKDNVKLPLMDEGRVDSCDVLSNWFAAADELVVLGRGPSAAEDRAKGLSKKWVLVTDPTYVTRDVFDGEPAAVLIGDRSQLIPQVAERFLGTPKEKRPLLMHMYLPGVPMLDFGSYGLPRPVPILPQIIRAGLYVHQPKKPYPTTGVFLALLAISLGKKVHLAGIDLYQHPSGKAYVGGIEPVAFELPKMHSFDRDAQVLKDAIARSNGNVHMPENLRELVRGM
jgi:hypothetical protein